MEHEELTKQIIGCAMTVHGALGPGYLESVYQNALAHELRKNGIQAECECRLKVNYDGLIVGDYVADIVVNGCVIIENKAVQALIPVHEVQLVSYLTTTGIEVGLLLNFGAQRLEFKRKTRVYRAKAERTFGQDEQD
jgi:GxxExxY protein